MRRHRATLATILVINGFQIDKGLVAIEGLTMSSVIYPRTDVGEKLSGAPRLVTYTQRRLREPTLFDTNVTSII